MITLERGLVVFFGFSSSSPASASGFCSSSELSDLVYAGERDITHTFFIFLAFFGFSSATSSSPSKLSSSFFLGALFFFGFSSATSSSPSKLLSTFFFGALFFFGFSSACSSLSSATSSSFLAVFFLAAVFCLGCSSPSDFFAESGISSSATWPSSYALTIFDLSISLSSSKPSSSVASLNWVRIFSMTLGVTQPQCFH